MASPSTSRSPRLRDVVIPRRGAAKRADESFSAQFRSSPIESLSDAETFGEPLLSKGKSKVKVRYGARSSSKRSGASATKQPPTATAITKPITAPPVLSHPRKTAAGMKRRLSESFSSSSDQDQDQGDGYSSELTPLSSPTKSISTTRSSMRTPVKKATAAATLKRLQTAATPSSASTHKSMKSPSAPRPRHVSSPALVTSSKSKPKQKPMPTPTSMSISSLIAHRSVEMGEKWSVGKLGMFVWVLVDMKGEVVEDEYEDDDEDAPQRMWWPGLNKNEKPLQIMLYGSVIPGTASVLIDVHNPSEKNVRDAASSCFTRSTFLISPPSTSRHPGDRHEGTTSSVLSSPKKKQKTDIESRWQMAVDAMNEDKNENDDADDLVFHTSPTKPESAKGKSAGKIKAKARVGAKVKGRKGTPRWEDEDTDMFADDDGEENTLWFPPLVDDSLNIGEEKVFAREKKNQNIYWPALVKYYKEPNSAKEEPLYGVHFLDEVKAEIPRSWFFASHQDEFATCKLGTWQSSIIEVLTDDDSDDEDTEEPSRAPSPEPTFPPPAPIDFYDLSIHEQLSYVKPVLRAILNDEYKPAQKRHLDFVKGGSARTRTQESAASRGTMSPDDVGKLQKCMMRWVLREERREGKNLYKDLEENNVEGVEEGAVEATTTAEDLASPLSSLPLKRDVLSSPAEIPPSSFSATGLAEDDHQVPAPAPAQLTSTSRPARQVGCEGYEGLAPQEKIGYCLNVLLPEAIRQVLLWREGKRTSFELLSDAEEEALHKAGEETLQKTDWVYDTMRMRESRLRIRMKGSAPESPGTIGGTRSRPRKRSVRRS